MSYPNYQPQQPFNHQPRKSNKVQNIVLSTILIAFLGGFAVFGYHLFTGPHSGYNGTAVIVDHEIRGQNCVAHIIRKDGKEIKYQSMGYRNECGKIDNGDTVDMKNGVIYPRE